MRCRGRGGDRVEGVNTDVIWNFSNNLRRFLKGVVSSLIFSLYSTATYIDMGQSIIF